MKTTLIFTVGALIGSAVTWYLTRKHYEKVIENELHEYKIYMEEKMNKLQKDLNDSSKEHIKHSSYKDISTIPVDDRAPSYYKDVNNFTTNIDPDLVNGYNERSDIKIISEMEWNDRDPNYEEDTLVLYANGIVTDYEVNVIEDVERMLGEYAIAVLLQSDETVLYVKNENLLYYYEIIKDDDPYDFDLMDTSDFLEVPAYDEPDDVDKFNKLIEKD